MSGFPLYVDHDRAASLLGCSVAKVEQAVADAGIRSKRYGRRLFFSRAGCEGAGKRSDVLLSDTNPHEVATITERPPNGQRDRLGIPLAAAAEQSGLTVDELQAKLIGKARMGVKDDGTLMIRVADLDRLRADGILLRRSEVARVDAVLAAADQPSSDPAVERRAEAVGRALGVSDLEPASPENRKSDATGSQVVEAKPRKRRRRVAPRRWGQS